MSDDTAMEEESNHWSESLEKIQEFLNSDDDESLESAITLAQEALKRSDDIPIDVQTTLYKIWIQCKLHLNQHDDVVKNAPSSIPRQSLQPLVAYALYRQGKYAEAYTKASTNQDESSRHVQAQSLFRLYQTNEAVDLYEELVENDDSSSSEVLTNAVAVKLANATPYVGGSPLAESIEQKIQELLSNQKGDEDYPYDLAYNLATWQVLSGNAQGYSLLQQARDGCMTTLDGEDEDVVEKEVAPLNANLDWCRLLQGGSMTATKIKGAAPAVQAVVQANAFKGTPKEPQEHWTALQRRIFFYNRALLQYRAGKLKECRSILDALVKELLQEPGKKKKSSPTFASASADDIAWWKARVIVVRAHCLVAESKKEEACTLLQNQLQELKSLGSSNVMDHAVAHVALHLNELSSESSAQELLQSLPESIGSQKAVIATLASLYHEAGESSKATALLQECGTDANQDLADFYMSQHDYKHAAKLYEELDSDDSAITAKLVQAVSYVDPQRACDIWSEAGIEEEEYDLDADALEAMEPPRFKTSRAAKPISVAAVSRGKERQKKSHDAVLRQRAKKRDAYLASKGLTGTTTTPDPERWLPKHERSRGGRRRRRGQQQQSQGGVSERDAAKLDVAARKKGDAAPNVKSTAHITVASDSKRGGRRR